MTKEEYCMCGHSKEDHDTEDGHCKEIEYDYDGVDEYSKPCSCGKFN